MCTCGCQQRNDKKDNQEAEKKNYLCSQCNTYREVPSEAQAPECCGKKMQEMD